MGFRKRFLYSLQLKLNIWHENLFTFIQLLKNLFSIIKLVFLGLKFKRIININHDLLKPNSLPWFIKFCIILFSQLFILNRKLKYSVQFSMAINIVLVSQVIVCKFGHLGCSTSMALCSIYLMVRFQWCWRSVECRVTLHCHCSQVYSDPEW